MGSSADAHCRARPAADCDRWSSSGTTPVDWHDVIDRQGAVPVEPLTDCLDMRAASGRLTLLDRLAAADARLDLPISVKADQPSPTNTDCAFSVVPVAGSCTSASSAKPFDSRS